MDKPYRRIWAICLLVLRMPVSQGFITQTPPEQAKSGPMWRNVLAPRLQWQRQGDAGTPNLGNGKQMATFICPNDGIDVVINPGIDKIAKVAVMGAEEMPGCFAYVTKRMYHLKVNITDMNNPPCGIQKDVDGTLTVRVASQSFMKAYGGSDRMYTIQCKLGQKMTAKTTGTVIDGNLPAGMAFQQDASMVKLEIRDITATRQLSQAGLGDMVVLHAELMNTAVYKGMDVNRCTAYDSIDKNGASMILLDNGCGTGDIIGFGKGFYQLPGLADNTLVSTPIPMFRFLRSAFVMVECEFNKLCTMDDKAACAQSCMHGGVSRRRRSGQQAPNSTVTTFMVLPESENARSIHDLPDTGDGCVDQMAVIVALGTLGFLVLLTTSAAIWLCTRWCLLRKQDTV